MISNPCVTKNLIIWLNQPTQTPFIIILFPILFRYGITLVMILLLILLFLFLKRDFGNKFSTMYNIKGPYLFTFYLLSDPEQPS